MAEISASCGGSKEATSAAASSRISTLAPTKREPRTGPKHPGRVKRGLREVRRSTMGIDQRPTGYARTSQAHVHPSLHVDDLRDSLPPAVSASLIPRRHVKCDCSRTRSLLTSCVGKPGQLNGAHQSLRVRLRRILLELKNHFQKDLLRNRARYVNFKRNHLEVSRIMRLKAVLVVQKASDFGGGLLLIRGMIVHSALQYDQSNDP